MGSPALSSLLASTTQLYLSVMARVVASHTPRAARSSAESSPFTSFWRLGNARRAEVANWAVNSSIGHSLFQLPPRSRLIIRPATDARSFPPRNREDVFPE